MESDNTDIRVAMKALKEGMKPIVSLDEGKQDTTQIFLNRTATGNLYPGSPLDEEARKLVIPGCELISVLGAGGMGCVYLAKQTQLERLVAVKALKVNVANDATLQEWLQKEAVTLGAINHPNIVSCYDVIHSKEQIFLVMEYVPGFMSVRSLVKKYGHLPENIVIRIIYEAVCGLAYVYGKGFIHRDVKPDNLLIYNEKKGSETVLEELFKDPDTRIKLCDFGIALKMVSKMTDNEDFTIARGSPNYMAPEQIATPEKIDFRADIYGLAGTAFFMLTGKPPFQFDDRDALLVHKQENDIPPVSVENVAIHSDFAAILAKMGSANPEERFASYEELRNKLFLLLQSKMERHTRRKTSFWRALCIILTVLLMGAAFYFSKHYIVEEYFRERFISLTSAIGYWQGDHAGWYIWHMPSSKGKIPVLMGDDMLGEMTLVQRLEANHTLEIQARRSRPGTVHFKLKNSSGTNCDIAWFMGGERKTVFSIEGNSGRNIVEGVENEGDLLQWVDIKVKTFKKNLIVFINDEPCYTGHVADFTPFIFSVDATNAGQIMLKGVFISKNDD